MNRLFLVTAAVLAAAGLAASTTPHAGAVTPRRCGAVTGPKVRIGKTTFSHYGIYVIRTDCGFARTTVSAVVRQHLPNSSTPVRAKAPNGWICVAQEVVDHVAVAGHCQGHSAAISWVGVGLHL